jgi:PBP1b-binding outer membrane lipoprotein LpoB
MKFTAVTQTKKKVASMIGILFLIFFLGGCLAPVNRVGSIRSCQQAETAVKQAQKQFDDANLQLTKGSLNPNISSNLAATMKNLQEAEETAFKMCNPSTTD